MCGIAGYIDYNSPARRPVLESMAHALRRRGPDAQGVHLEGPCGLAHARLSIIDLAGSPQPMLQPGSDISLVFNGEIYNYQPLRAEYQAKGETFVTNGDTEIILRLVGREWEKCLHRFDGMFAFAAWDRRQQRMLIARDAIGEKPLFYATPAPGVLVFGSEIKALLQHPQVDASLDEDALRQALRFRAVYGERSLHKGIRQLPPGHYLEFSPAGIKIARFYDIGEEIRIAEELYKGLSESDLILRGEEILRASVEERMIADVPVGAFLSGGLDSSIIVALMRDARNKSGGGGGERVRTFSVGFTDDPHSELPFARTVADAIGTAHTEVSVGDDLYLQRLVELTECRDAPVSEPADVAVAEMSRIAKQSVKVVLSGEGADEILCGYPKYRFASANPFLRGGIRLFGARRTAWLAGRLGVDARRALVAARALSLPNELDRTVQWFSYFDQSDLMRLLPGMGWTDASWAATINAQRDAIALATGNSPAQRMQLVDCLTWLPGNMLERGDRMTMAEGLEARVPFLDKELVRFGLALPDHMKIRGKSLKWIERQWAAKCLPPQIAGRKKWGFRVPLAQWFRGKLRPMLHDYLTRSDGLCGTFGNKAAITELLQSHDQSRIDANLTLWTLLTAEIWYQDIYKRRAQLTTRMKTA